MAISESQLNPGDFRKKKRYNEVKQNNIQKEKGDFLICPVLQYLLEKKHPMMALQ